ncbi:Citrate synthase-like protein, partial [mine drainage metagenome]
GDRPRCPKGPGRGHPAGVVYPNVDYYGALVLEGIGLTSEWFTPTFALARSVGWVATRSSRRAATGSSSPSSITTVRRLPEPGRAPFPADPSGMIGRLARVNDLEVRIDRRRSVRGRRPTRGTLRIGWPGLPGRAGGPGGRRSGLVEFLGYGVERPGELVGLRP